MTKVTKAYLLLMISVYLLFAGTGTYEHIVESKYLLFCLLTTVFFIISMVLKWKDIWEIILHPKKLSASIKNTGAIQRCILLYLVITWISAFASEYFPYTILGASRFEGALTITFYLMICLIIAKYGTADRILLVVFSIAIVIFDCVCILQLAGENPFNLYPEGYNYSGADVDYAGAYIGTIGNVDLIGAFFTIAIPILIFSLIKLKDTKKWMLLLPLVPTIYLLFQIRVYAGMVALAGLVFVFLFAFEMPIRRRLSILGMVLAAGIVVLTILYCIVPTQEMLYQVHEILHGNPDIKFGTYRVLIWNKVMNIVPDYLIIGHGPDTMIFGDFGKHGALNIETGIYLSHIDAAHNEYLNVLYHQGILGLISFSGIIVFSLIEFIRNGGKNKKVVILGAGVVCYAIQAFFGISMCASAAFFWICLGLFIHENSVEGEELTTW